MNVSLKDHLRAARLAAELQTEDGPAPDEGQENCRHGLPAGVCYDCAHEDDLPGEEGKVLSLTRTVDRNGNPVTTTLPATPETPTSAPVAPTPDMKRRGNPEALAKARANKRGYTNPIAMVVEIERRTGKVITESVLAALREHGSEELAARSLRISVAQIRTLMKGIGIKRKTTYTVD